MKGKYCFFILPLAIYLSFFPGSANAVKYWITYHCRNVGQVTAQIIGNTRFLNARFFYKNTLMRVKYCLTVSELTGEAETHQAKVTMYSNSLKEKLQIIETMTDHDSRDIGEETEEQKSVIKYEVENIDQYLHEDKKLSFDIDMIDMQIDTNLISGETTYILNGQYVGTTIYPLERIDFIKKVSDVTDFLKMNLEGYVDFAHFNPLLSNSGWQLSTGKEEASPEGVTVNFEKVFLHLKKTGRERRGARGSGRRLTIDNDDAKSRKYTRGLRIHSLYDSSGLSMQVETPNLHYEVNAQIYPVRRLLDLFSMFLSLPATQEMLDTHFSSPYSRYINFKPASTQKKNKKKNKCSSAGAVTGSGHSSVQVVSGEYYLFDLESWPMDVKTYLKCLLQKRISRKPAINGAMIHYGIDLATALQIWDELVTEVGAVNGSYVIPHLLELDAHGTFGTDNFGQRL